MRPLPSPAVRLLPRRWPGRCSPVGVWQCGLRDEAGEVFANGDFAGTYPRRGGPALSPAALALVSVLQYAERLTDRRAAHAGAPRVDWKYALGWEMADLGSSGPNWRRCCDGPTGGAGSQPEAFEQHPDAPRRDRGQPGSVRRRQGPERLQRRSTSNLRLRQEDHRPAPAHQEHRLAAAGDRWAFCALLPSACARAHYDRRRDTGDWHAVALRSLFNNLLG